MSMVRLGVNPGIDELRVVTDEMPGTPGRGEMRVRIEASSLNQHDLAVALGRLPSAPGRVLLSDAAGIVEAVGDDVHEFAVGDSVMSCFFPEWHDGPQTIADFSTTPGDGVGGFARRRVVRPAAGFTRIPRHLTTTQAATLTTAGLTAWRALAVEGNLKAGDTVLVMGSGGVSLFALQFAKAMGARVIATSSSDDKLRRLQALGADEVINYRTTPDWGQAARELTDGQGVDLVVEIGGPGTLAQSIVAGRIGATIALIGVLTGIQGVVPTALLMGRQQRLQGITVGSRRQQLDMVRAMESTGIQPVIDKVFQLDDLAAAFRYMQTGAHFGKIGITMSDAG